MELERLSVDLRPRTSWEAIDLGFRMARAHYGRLLLVTTLATAPIVLVAQGLLGQWPWLALFVPWWTKPIWERWPLHLLSRSLFGETAGVREALRGVGRGVFRDALPWLTVRRLSPTRSMDLPVTQLEGLVGSARSHRLALLRRGPYGSAATALTVVLAHVEFALPLAAVTLLQMLTPETVEWSAFGWLFGEGADDRLHTLVAGLLGHAAALVIAPFYVAGGFSLYVHRRSLLEGWDLEIAFRRIAARLADRDGRGLREGGHARAAAARTAAAALAALLLAHGGSLPARAQETAAEPPASADGEPGIEALAEQARTDIRSVLAGEAFHQTRTVSLPRFVHDCELSPDEDDEASAGLPAWLAAALEWVASSAELLFVTAFVLLVGYVAWRAAAIAAPARGPAARRPRTRPRRLAGLDVRPESLPADVPGAVLEAWRAGRARDAVALLYRATLARLVDVHAVALAESDTERECLVAVRAEVDPPRAALFDDVTRTWLAIAYAHRSPDEARVRGLCAEWRRLFDARDRDAPGEPRGAAV